MFAERVEKLLKNKTLSEVEIKIIDKVLNNEQISVDEGVFLFENASLNYLSVLANFVKEKINGKKVYFNKNFHIEPTNICVYNCKFCSYKRRVGEPEAWDNSLEQIMEQVEKFQNTDITEVHIVGGVHPNHDVYFYGNIISKIKNKLPKIHIKAFTAIELDFMIRKANMTIEKGLFTLKEYGLDSIPGGGAEIFDEEIRKQICDDKSSSKLWLNIHKTAHKLGISSNATILYGHIESYKHRIDHLNRLRELQNETNGFNAFIPLKYRNFNNKLSHINEVSIIEDMRNYAVSRIFLNNIPHLKAYWVMLGKQHAQMSLAFGVDDLDGTINDSTKIYTMAGVDDTNVRMTCSEMVQLIKSASLIPVERDSVYNILKTY
jgi:aminodeoxyfutalosine synthase